MFVWSQTDKDQCLYLTHPTRFLTDFRPFYSHLWRAGGFQNTKTNSVPEIVTRFAPVEVTTKLKKFAIIVRNSDVRQLRSITADHEVSWVAYCRAQAVSRLVIESWDLINSHWLHRANKIFIRFAPFMLKIKLSHVYVSVFTCKRASFALMSSRRQSWSSRSFSLVLSCAPGTLTGRPSTHCHSGSFVPFYDFVCID